MFRLAVEAPKTGELEMKHVTMKQAPSLSGWLIAVGVAVLAFALCMMIFGFSLTQAAFTASVVGGIVGVILGLPLAEAEGPKGTLPKAEAPKAEPVAAKAATPAVSVEAAPAAKPEPAPAPSSAPAAAKRPEALSAARGGKADDLKEIKGIGPKLEVLCNTLGFYHFDQIANWSEDEIAWVDENLEGFKGRVTRDEWVAQAKALAAGTKG
jgi:predicted flap endonuclease-1-like 5' DNA nuclease